MTMNQKIARPLIPGETPSKGMEVVIWTPKRGDNQGSEELVTWGADLPGLLPHFRAAVKEAKTRKRKDGLTRNVLIRQVLVREIV